MQQKRDVFSKQALEYDVTSKVGALKISALADSDMNDCTKQSSRAFSKACKKSRLKQIDEEDMQQKCEQCVQQASKR